MARRSGLYLAVYDISSDKEREAVAEVLEGLGVRVQESVFEVRLTRSGRENLLAALRALDLQTGWLALYRIDDKAAIKRLGRPPDNPLAEDRHALVL